MSKHRGSADLKQKDAGRTLTQNTVGKSGSIRSFRMDDDENVGPKIDSYVPLRVSKSPRPRSRTKNESDTDPYVALRIANSPRRIIDATGHSYHHGPLRVADSPSRKKSSTDGNEVPNTDPYVHLKIAGSHISSAEIDDEVIYDSNGSFVSEEDGSDSAGSNYDRIEDVFSDYGGNSGSEEIDKDLATGRARVLMGSGDAQLGNDDAETSSYVRLSVAGNAAKQEHPVYARLPLSASDVRHSKDKGEEFRGFARVSVAGSDIDYERNDFAKVSRAGSDGGHGHTRVSAAGSDIDHGQDVYAKLSVAGSENEHGISEDADLSGPARVSVLGSENGHEKDTYGRGSIAGSEVSAGKETNARISVAGSESEYRKDFDGDGLGYTRLTVVGAKVDRSDSNTSSSKSEDSQHKVGHVFRLGEVLSDRKPHDEDDEELWEKEFEAYMEQSLQSRAKLQYRMRVLLISPLFELKNRQLLAFSDLYKSKFGDYVEATGFSSVAKLCRAMPHIVQIKQLEEAVELVLVDSSKNRRAVSGIRSGLRRIVYDTLKSCEALSGSQFQERCSELLGKPLVEVLSEHGYENLDVENLLNDMQDIAAFEKTGLESEVYLCIGAEDPALTDGLLIKSTNLALLKSSSIAEPKEEISNVDDRGESAKDIVFSGKHSYPQRESLKTGSSLTLRSLKNELRRFGSFSRNLISSKEDEILQARLRMRILLAFHNCGHGVEVTVLPDIFAKCFGRNLDLQLLRVGSVMELVSNWHDIFLLQEPKPGWVFLVPSQSNRRLLNTLRTSLRSSVFSVLMTTYPDGLEPLDFLHRLQQEMSGELWEILDASGYICSDPEKNESILSSSSSSDFQLVDFEEICILLDDMMDFVRLGSNEDGSVVVKLRNGDVPLMELSDCNLEETDVRSFDELFVNLMMIAVDDAESSGAEDNNPENCGIINFGHVQSLVNSFEGSGGLRSAHSQTPDSLRLKHEIRLILGCPEYLDSGLAWNKLSSVYKDRTDRELGPKSKCKSLLRAMPDIVSKTSFGGDFAYLSKTPKNLRILSATRAGFRQVLFWALVKNPGGVWANLLEGWFVDFAGMSLAASLQEHGYELSKNRPFSPVYVFLKDMNDLLLKKCAPFEVYAWAGEVKDPVHEDACLLGLSELLIQYDPIRSELGKVSNEEADLVESLDKTFLLKEKADREANMCDEHLDMTHLMEEKVESGACMFNGTLEIPSFREDGDVGDTDSEDALASNVHSKQGISDLKTNLDEDNVLTYASQEERDREGYVKDFMAKDVLGSGEIAESAGLSESGLLGFDGTEVQQDAQNRADEILKEDTDAEEYHRDCVNRGGSEFAENEEPARDNENFLLPQEDEMGWEHEGASSGPNSEAYAQLRVAGKGPKVNLDEWQFTDSDDDENYEVNDDLENEFEDEESDYSVDDNSSNEKGPILPRVTYVEPKNKETNDASRAWVLPNKGIPWK